jgi:outer membrane scaffolding protein for murein synthesis (MipA/OmpV family)
MPSLRPLLAIGLLLLAATPARGQQPESRLSIGLGLASVPNWVDGIVQELRTGLSSGSYETKSRFGLGAITVQYERFLSRRFTLLGAAGLEYIRRDVVDDDRSGDLSSTWAHAMVGVAFHHRSETLSLYSNLAAGIAGARETTDLEGGPEETASATVPAFQITLLGMRLERRFAPFLELGLGFRGTLVLGASYDF